MKWSEFLVTLFCKCNYIGNWRLAQKNYSGAVFNKFACCFFGVFTYLCDFSYQSLRVFYAMFVVDSITILWYSKYIKNGLICLWLKLAKTIFHKQNTYFKRLNFFWFLQFCFFFFCNDWNSVLRNHATSLSWVEDWKKILCKHELNSIYFSILHSWSKGL